MKLINKTLHYISKSNETPGIWLEKIFCDLSIISFNTNRKYITNDNYPFKLKKDIHRSIYPLINSLQIKSHVGNLNKSYDFITNKNETVSLKSNISGFKVCPQNIGQLSLKRFSEKCNIKPSSILEIKSFIFTNINYLILLYLENLFCCNHTIYFNFPTGKVFYFHKINDIYLDPSVNINFNKNLLEWNESITLKENNCNSFGEFQIHNKRNCIKFRFNMNTVINMLKSSKIKGIKTESYNLGHIYNIKINHNYNYSNQDNIEKSKSKVQSNIN